MSLWLIGAGPMALQYAEVLTAMGRPFEVVGRSEESAARFEALTGIPVRRGGITTALAGSGPPDQAIVAVGIDQLAMATSALVFGGTRRVLVEKPAGIDSAEIRALGRTVEDVGAEVSVAYNRRYYSSVAAMRKMIEQDGGITSCVFEITEYSDTIVALDIPSTVKESWFLANTSHVVDLVISVCGPPDSLSSQTVGTLPWHPAAAQFVGSGLTERGIPFSYRGDWEAPGRWGVEICTTRRRYVLRPMEELHKVDRESPTIERVEIDDRLDREFKPGVYLQTLAFLEDDRTLACTLSDHVRNCDIYDQIAGYSEGRAASTVDG
ncbi:MAG: hypothetical protein QF419_05640 [Acidimicrobiales bacterium]|nr:hypothetical protein [Acidimicrobiales bacterium]